MQALYQIHIQDESPRQQGFALVCRRPSFDYLPYRLHPRYQYPSIFD